MRSYQDTYNELSAPLGRTRCIAAHDLADEGANVMAVTVRTMITPTGRDESDGYHNTLVNFLCKGDSKKIEDALKTCVGDGERLSSVPNASKLGADNLHIMTMHCNLSPDRIKPQATKKMKAMVDALGEKGLVDQNTTEMLYRELKLLLTPETTIDPTRKPNHARH